MYYYIAHRLFAAHDRALAAQLAQRVATEVGPERVFLPFCDTDEESLVAEVKGRRLFELDCERLQRLTAMIAVLHGPSLDDGVCMEIGYAAACGVPVTVVSTDFQTYSLTEDGPRLDFPDPLIQAVAARVVRIPNLGPMSTAGPGSARFTAFVNRNRAQLEAAFDAVIDAHAASPPGQPDPRRHAHPRRRVFIEPSPYSAGGEELREACRATGHVPSLSTRLSAPDPLSAARGDLLMACESTHLLVDVSGPEAPPGSALLIGAASARGRRIAAYSTRTAYTHAHGREPNWRNLMVQYAVHARLSTPQAVSAWLAS